MRRTSFLALNLVICSMIGVVAYAATPEAVDLCLQPAQAPAGPPAAEPPFVGAPATYGPQPELVPAQYTTPVQTPLQAPTPSYSSTPAVSQNPTPTQDPVKYDDPNTILTANDCLRYGLDGKAPMSLEKLVAFIEDGVSRLGPRATVDGLRLRIQTYLDLSRDNETVKTDAIKQLLAYYAPSSTAHRALADPFILANATDTGVNGYDPCGNPTAFGGPAFGNGPFANLFSTINPVPTVLTKTTTVVEGGQT